MNKILREKDNNDILTSNIDLNIILINNNTKKIKKKNILFQNIQKINDFVNYIEVEWKTKKLLKIFIFYYYFINHILI